MSHEEPLVDPASEAVLIPLDEWPVVHPEPAPEVSAEQARREEQLNAEWTAQEQECRAYLEAVGTATAGLGEDEVNAYCRELEAWNDAVAGGPRHAEQP